MLKALSGPYGHTGVRFIPTGGIHTGNLEDYLDIKTTLAIGGSWFVDQRLIAARDFQQIHELTVKAMKIVAKFKGGLRVYN